MKVKIAEFSASGRVSAPPSKSHAHRLLIAAALGAGRTTITGVGSAKDVLATVSCLRALGAKITKKENSLTVRGIFREGAEVPAEAEFDFGESASTMRFMIPVAGALGVKVRYALSDGLAKRPNGRFFDRLSEHGMRFGDGVFSGKLTPGTYVVDSGLSSQFASGLMLALPLVGDSEIVFDGKPVSRKYIDMTLAAMRHAGASAEKTERGIAVYRSGYAMPARVCCEGDWSGAAAMLAFGAIGASASVTGLNMKSKQADKAIIDALIAFGANVAEEKNGVTCSNRGRLKAIKFDASGCPDLAMTVACLAAFADGVTVISGVGRLRAKESDRLASLKALLGAFGVEAEADGDALSVRGTERPARPAAPYVAADHRMAMCAALLMSATGGEIDGAECVGKSFPDFFIKLKTLGGEENVDMER